MRLVTWVGTASVRTRPIRQRPEVEGAQELRGRPDCLVASISQTGGEITVLRFASSEAQAGLRGSRKACSRAATKAARRSASAVLAARP